MQDNNQAQATSPAGVKPKQGVMIVDVLGVLLNARDSATRPGEKAYAKIGHGIDILRSIKDVNHYAVLICNLPPSESVAVQSVLHHFAPELVCGLDYTLVMCPEDQAIVDVRSQVVSYWKDYAAQKNGAIAMGIVAEGKDLNLFETEGVPAIVYTELQPFNAANLHPVDSFDQGPASPEQIAAALKTLEIVEEEPTASVWPTSLNQPHGIVGEGEMVDPVQALLSNDNAGLDHNIGHMDSKEADDHGYSQYLKYPQYWRQLPANWKFIDFYRLCELFPRAGIDNSGRLDHALKKLVLPGVRTGGKSPRSDIQEAYDTLGAWLKDNPA